MKLIIIILLVFVTTSFGQFRNTTWGMSEKQVKRVETEELIREQENLLVYSVRVANMGALLLYNFRINKLTSTGYLFKEEHTNKTDNIDDYQNLQDIVKQKYGEPTDDNVNWKDDLYYDNPSDWGMAVAVGHLEYDTKWEDDKTKIILSLLGDNYEVKLFMIYFSKEFMHLEQEQSKEKNLDDF